MRIVLKIFFSPLILQIYDVVIFCTVGFKQISTSSSAPYVFLIFKVSFITFSCCFFSPIFLFQVPYLQIRENNWTFNADVNGRWNVRYDL